MTDPKVIAEGCGNIIRRIEDYAISSTTCESVGQLEHFHDMLVGEVINLAGMVQTLALAAAARQGGDVKQAPAESPQSGDGTSQRPTHPPIGEE